MEDLYSHFRSNCAVLAGCGTEVTLANDWFLSFATQEPELCWSFSAEVLSEAHHRLNEEVSEMQEEEVSSHIKNSSHLYECFFSLKLLQNVILSLKQWSQVPEEKKIYVQQLIWELLFHSTHPLYHVPLICNQLTTTLATLVAASSMDLALSMAHQYSLNDDDNIHISNTIWESAEPIHNSMLSVADGSIDGKSNIILLAQTMHDLPAAGDMLLRSRLHGAMLSDRCTDSTEKFLNYAHSSLSKYDTILLRTFEKVSGTLLDQISSLLDLEPREAFSAFRDAGNYEVNMGLLNKILDCLIVWTEASSSQGTTSWLSITHLCVTLQQQEGNYSADSPHGDGRSLPSVLETLSFVINALISFHGHILSSCDHVNINCVYFSSFTTSLESFFTKTFALFGNFLLLPTIDVAVEVYDHFTRAASCVPETISQCGGVLHIFKCVTLVVEWIFSPGCIVLNSNGVLQQFCPFEPPCISFSNLKNSLNIVAASTSQNSMTIFLTEMQRCVFLSSPLLKAYDCNDMCNFEEISDLAIFFISLSDTISRLLENHLFTIVTLDGSPICQHENHDDVEFQNMNSMSNMLYCCMLFPHMNARVTVLEAFASLLAESVNTRHNSSQRHNELIQKSLGDFLYLFFSGSFNISFDISSFVSVAVALPPPFEEEEINLDREIISELQITTAEVFRCMWRMVLSLSHILSVVSPQLSFVFGQHISNSCEDLHLLYRSHGNKALSPDSNDTVAVLKENCINAARVQNNLSTLLFYLSSLVEYTVEHFGLDEVDEDDEEEHFSGKRKKIGDSLTRISRDWLSIMYLMTSHLLILRDEILRSQDIIRGSQWPTMQISDDFDVFHMYGKLWESCSHIFKVVDCLGSVRRSGDVVDLSEEFLNQENDIGSAYDEQIHSQLLVMTWDVIHYALCLSSVNPSELNVIQPKHIREISNVLSACQGIAESNKFVSSFNAPNELEKWHAFISKEDEMFLQLSIEANSFTGIPPTCFSLSPSAAYKFYSMMASYIRIVGLSNDDTENMRKENILEVVLESVVCPLEDIFIAHAKDNYNSDESSSQRPQNSSVLFDECMFMRAVNLNSRLKGLLIVLHDDDVFVQTHSKLLEELFDILNELIGMRYIFSNPSLAEPEEFYIMPSRENFCFNQSNEIERYFYLHNSFVGVLCVALDSPSARCAFHHVEVLIQSVHSSKLIQLVTTLIRWSNSNTFQLEDDISSMGKLVSVVLYRCLSKLTNIEKYVNYDDLDWLSNEMAMTWRLLRQMSVTTPLLFLVPPELSTDSSETILSLMMRLGLSVVNISTSSVFLHDESLSLQMKSLITVFDQFRTKTINSLCYASTMPHPEVMTHLNSICSPYCLEILATLLANILFGDHGQCISGASPRDLKHLFSHIYMLLFDVTASTTTHHLALTQELLDSIFWPVCSRMIESQDCNSMREKIVNRQSISPVHLDEFTESPGVFARSEGMNSTCVEFMSLKICNTSVQK